MKFQVNELRYESFSWNFFFTFPSSFNNASPNAISIPDSKNRYKRCSIWLEKCTIYVSLQILRSRSTEFIKQHPNPQPSLLPQAWPSTRPRHSSSCKSWSLSYLFLSFPLHPSILLADANQEAGHRRYVRWRRIAEVGGWGRKRFRDRQTKKAR